MLLENMKGKVIIMCGSIGSLIANALGGWDNALETLLIFMIIDFLLGILNSIIYKTSPKSENGALSSKAGLKGIYKKVLMLFLIVVANRIDLTFNFDYVRTGTCVALIVNELISILETYKLSGLATPKIIENVIDVISMKEDSNNENRHAY